VEGPDESITKAKDWYGKRRGIGDTPVARPDPVRKSWKSLIWFTRIEDPRQRGGTGTRRDIKDIPSGETRSCPEILEKHLVHSDNHGISVLDPRVQEPRRCGGAGHEKGLER
jgi:hypothetical protein